MKNPKTPTSKNITTEDILLTLCQSTASVLTKATNSQVHFATLFQKINKTSLKPDLSCFVHFDGGFCGLVVLNFSAKAAMELYRLYLTYMNIPLDELVDSHTEDEVSDVLGELMNQIVGNFTNQIQYQLQTTITQNQPKMMTINRDINVSVDTNFEQSQAQRVSFMTAENNPFYLELAMDQTEFVQFEQLRENQKINTINTYSQNDIDDLLDELDL